MRSRRPLPDPIKNAPRLRLGLELYFDAFLDLQGDRGGMGDGRIPWTAVNVYCRENGYEDDLRDDVHYYVRAMDEAWMKWVAAKRERERGQ